MAGSKETDETGEARKTPTTAWSARQTFPETELESSPRSENGLLNQRTAQKQLPAGRSKGREARGDGPSDGCTVNSFLKPKSRFESPFRTRATKPGPNIRTRMWPSHTGLGPKNGSIQPRREIKEKGGNPDLKIASGKNFR